MPEKLPSAEQFNNASQEEQNEIRLKLATQNPEYLEAYLKEMADLNQTNENLTQIMGEPTTVEDIINDPRKLTALIDIANKKIDKAGPLTNAEEKALETLEQSKNL